MLTELLGEALFASLPEALRELLAELLPEELAESLFDTLFDAESSAFAVATVAPAGVATSAIGPTAAPVSVSTAAVLATRQRLGSIAPVPSPHKWVRPNDVGQTVLENIVPCRGRRGGSAPLGEVDEALRKFHSFRRHLLPRRMQHPERRGGES